MPNNGQSSTHSKSAFAAAKALSGRLRSDIASKRPYFDEILIQSSWARAFNLFQSADATSQFTMVRLTVATWPLATVDVCIEL